MARLRFRWSAGEITAELLNTPTAKALIDALPFRARVSTWGDEVYFPLAIQAVLEPDAQQVVEPGTVCYWVEGRSVALPYGPTPISREDECRLVARCNILGRLEGDPRVLRSLAAGSQVEVQLA